MPAINITALNNADLDAAHIAAIATSPALTATDRLGNVKPTLKAAIDTIKAFNSRGAWVTGTLYLVKDLVLTSGTWYVAVTQHTASAAFATDAANWRVYQGVVLSDLAAPGAAATIGSIQPRPGAIPRTVEDRLSSGTPNAADFSGLQAAITNNRKVELIRGVTNVSATITTIPGSVISGVPQMKSGVDITEASVLSTSASPALTIGGLNNDLRGFTLSPTVANVVGSIGINGLDKYFLTLEDARLNGYETGIRQEKSLYHTYNRVDVRSGKNGAVFAAAVGAWNVAWFNNVITLDHCRFTHNTEHNLDFQGQGLVSNNCDFSAGASLGAKASVRVRAGNYDAVFNSAYMEGLAVGATAYLIEGGTARINGGYVQGGGSAARLQSLVRATGGARVIIDGIETRDFFNNLLEADGAGTVIYVMPGTKFGSSSLNFKLETNGGKVIDLSAFDPATKLDLVTYDASFSQQFTAIPVAGTYTYQLTSLDSVDISAFLTLNSGFSLFSVTGRVFWQSPATGNGANINTLVSSNASVTFSINNTTGLLTITNGAGLAGNILFKAQRR